MTIFETQTHETYGPSGNLISSVNVQVDVTEETNQSAIETNLGQDLVIMQAIIDATNASINSNPAPHIKNMARMLKRLGRTAIKDYSEAD